jgi:hypothetical protein
MGRSIIIMALILKGAKGSLSLFRPPRDGIFNEEKQKIESVSIIALGICRSINKNKGC